MKKVGVLLLTSAIVFPSFGTATVLAAESTAAKAVTAIKVDETSKLSTQDKQLIDQAKISKEEAIAAAKKFFPVPKELSEQSVRFYSNWYQNGGMVWQIEFANKQDNGRLDARLTFTIDAATGQVTEVNQYQYDPNKEASYPPKVDWAQAKKIGTAFVMNNFKNKENELKYDSFYEDYQKPPLDGKVNYNVRFSRTINGIPYNDNYIELNIDGDGNIQNFTYRWDNNLEFPTVKGILSKTKAIAKIKETMPLQLQYRKLYELGRFNGNPDEAPIVLAYDNQRSSNFLDAKTGEWLDYAGEPVQPSEATRPVADQPLQAPVKRDKALTQDEAKTQIETYFTIPKDVKLDNVSYDENGYPNNVPAWRFSWQNGENRFWLNAAVNAKTGEIINFYQENYNGPAKDTAEPKYSYDDAKKIAIDKLKELVPSKVHQLALVGTKQDMYPAQQREYYFSFNRLQAGIPFQDQWVNMSVSAETGEVIRFDQNWDDSLTFPDNKGVIDQKQAVDLYLEQFDVAPKYVMFRKDKYRAQNEQPEQTIALVYELRQKPSEEPTYLDAKAGKWLSIRTGEEISAQQPATDIKGHWAEKELQLMIDYNALKVDEKGMVYPNQEITRGEMVKMLMLSTNPDPYFYKMSYDLQQSKASFNDVSTSSQYFPYVELALRQGLIDKGSKDFNPDELVSREELAELIVRALNMYELSKVAGLFNLDFKDEAAIQSRGVVAIVQHLNIMNGANGYFYPDKNVSRAEAAKTYVEFLKQRNKYTK